MGIVVVRVPFICCASVVALYGAAFPFLVICPVDGSCIRTHTGVARVVDKLAFKIMRWKRHFTITQSVEVFFGIWTQSYTVAIDE